MNTLNRIGMASLAVAMLIAVGGCRYTTQSGLPEHIRTVQVPMFRNNTMYKGLETNLTNGILAQLQNEPQVRVVNSGANATIEGTILSVNRSIYRETKKDKPASVRVAITVRFTFYDEVEQRAIWEDVTLNSSESSSSAGLYEVDRGELQATAETAAVNELAQELVRRCISMW